MNRHLPEGDKPPLIRPINYIRLISVVTVLLGTVTFVTVLAPYVLPVIQNRNVWAAVSLIAILLFTSGQMFNHIRKVPYVVNDGKGGISYFAGGFSNQFGMETQIIAATCEFQSTELINRLVFVTYAAFIIDTNSSGNRLDGVLSFAIISLALKVPRIADAKAQQLAVVVWGIVLLVVYSFLMSAFRIKNGGYPFFLPPF
jgi:oligosaccharyltransferase complex subunit gamma